MAVALGEAPTRRAPEHLMSSDRIVGFQRAFPHWEVTVTKTGEDHGRDKTEKRYTRQLPDFALDGEDETVYKRFFDGEGSDVELQRIFGWAAPNGSLVGGGPPYLEFVAHNSFRPQVGDSEITVTDVVAVGEAERYLAEEGAITPATEAPGLIDRMAQAIASRALPKLRA